MATIRVEQGEQCANCGGRIVRRSATDYYHYLGVTLGAGCPIQILSTATDRCSAVVPEKVLTYRVDGAHKQRRPPRG